MVSANYILLKLVIVLFISSNIYLYCPSTMYHYQSLPKLFFILYSKVLSINYTPTPPVFINLN